MHVKHVLSWTPAAGVCNIKKDVPYTVRSGYAGVLPTPVCSHLEDR